MRTPPSGCGAISASARWVTSTSRRAGCTPPFSRSIRLVPPPMKTVPGLPRQLDRVGHRLRALVVDVEHRVSPVCRRLRGGRRAAGSDLAHRRDDVRIGAAAAQVAAHALADFVVAEPGGAGAHVGRRRADLAGAVLVEQGDRRADLPRRAVAALEGVVLDERGLHRVQRLGRAEALDGGDVDAFLHHRERQAGVDAAAVDEHGAGAALAAVAALLGAGQAGVFAQRIEQRDARLEHQFMGCGR